MSDDILKGLVAPLVVTLFDQRLAQYNQKLEVIESQQQAVATAQRDLAQSLKRLEDSNAHLSADLAKVKSHADGESETRNQCDVLAARMEQLELGMRDVGGRILENEASNSALATVLAGFRAVLNAPDDGARRIDDKIHDFQACRNSPIRSLTSDETLLAAEQEPHLAEWKRQGRTGTIQDFAHSHSGGVQPADGQVGLQVLGSTEAANGIDFSSAMEIDGAATAQHLVGRTDMAGPLQLEINQQSADDQTARILAGSSQLLAGSHTGAPAHSTVPPLQGFMGGPNGLPQDAVQRFQNGGLGANNEDSSSIIRDVMPKPLPGKSKAVAFDLKRPAATADQESDDHDEIQYGSPPKSRAGPAKKTRKLLSAKSTKKNLAEQVAKANTKLQEEVTADGEDESSHGGTRRSQRKPVPKTFADDEVVASLHVRPSPQVVVPRRLLSVEEIPDDHE